MAKGAFERHRRFTACSNSWKTSDLNRKIFSGNCERGWNKIPSGAASVPISSMLASVDGNRSVSIDGILAALAASSPFSRTQRWP